MKLTRLHDRMLEWGLASGSVMYGAIVAVPYWQSFAISRTGDRTGYEAVLALMPEWLWGVLVAIAGLLHVVALQINGMASWTPFARFVALLLNILLFAMLGLAFQRANPFGSAVLAYGFFIPWLGLLAMWRVGRDMQKEYEIWTTR